MSEQRIIQASISTFEGKHTIYSAGSRAVRIKDCLQVSTSKTEMSGKWSQCFSAHK
jgi:hypothetical protein